MSIIFGIINHSKEHPITDLMDMACNSVQKFPHDNKSTWIKKNVGLGWFQLYDTPESVHDRQPVCWADRYTMIGKARLDNREDLCRIFNIEENEKKQIPDTYLLKLSYEKWGSECSKYLFGDWAFAIWDDLEKKLFLARDQLGITALYCSKTDKYFIFSSNLHILLALPFVSKEMDMVIVAQLLVGWNGTPETTIYKNIFRLPPANNAHYFNNKFQQKQYWKIEDVTEIKYNNDQDYVDACHELFTNAVKSRIRSFRQISSTLSSGLDSSSVTAYVALLLKLESKKINAYTHVPLNDTQNIYNPTIYGNEGPLARLVAEKFSNINHSLVDSRERDPMKGIIDSFDIFCSPGRNASNQYWIISILEMAKNHGNGTLFTGQGGNVSISWPFRHYYHSESSGFKRYIHDFIPDNLFRYWHILKGNHPLLKLSLINPGFAKEINLLKTMEDAGYQFYYNRNRSLKQIRNYSINNIVSKTGAMWQESGDYFGLNIYDPTLDLKLLEFCFGIPENQFYRQDNERFLIRRLMKNKLPQEIIDNRKKGKQSADIILRLKNAFFCYNDLVEKMKGSDLCSQIIDLKKMSSELNQINNMSSKIDVKMSSGLLRGFNMGAFLLIKP